MRAEAPIMGVGTLPKLGIILFILTVLLGAHDAFTDMLRRYGYTRHHQR